MKYRGSKKEREAKKGGVKASQQGLAGLALQNRVPDARIVYVSATGATVVSNLAYLMAKRRKETETLCPEGTRIAFSGGDYQGHQAIWSVLDATKEKYPDMVLLHGGTPKGAELIAAKWADSRNVTQVVFKPDWKAHGMLLVLEV